MNFCAIGNWGLPVVLLRSYPVRLVRSSYRAEHALEGNNVGLETKAG